MKENLFTIIKVLFKLGLLGFAAYYGIYLKDYYHGAFDLLLLLIIVVTEKKVK